MKKLLVSFLALGALLLSASLLLGQHGEKHEHGSAHGKSAEGVEEEIDTRTVTGEIIDITCYLRHDSTGEKHIKCATYCATLGMPLGLLEDETNKIYLIIPAGHEDPKGAVMPYIGKKVKVDAILYSMGGLTGLEIEKIEESK
jgi:hypothetical protein